MGSQTKYVGTCVNDASIGTKIWANPGNATADDNADAATPSSATATSNRLKGTMAGNLFTIPDGSTIDGVTVGAELLVGMANSWQDYEVRLVKGGTAGTGTNKGRGPGTYWPTSRTAVGWGSQTDLWGLELTVADVNAGGFGASIVTQNPTADRCVASVDFISVAVYYTNPIKEIAGADTATATTGYTMSVDSGGGGKITVEFETEIATTLSSDNPVPTGADFDTPITTGITKTGMD